VTVGARALTAAAVKFGDEVHGEYVEDCVIRPYVRCCRIC
jgi:hypothetical protein